MRYINFEDEAIVPDDFFMKEALKEAHIALGLDEVPIGAVIVYNGKIIGLIAGARVPRVTIKL